jgi:hypothetical protein
MSGEFNSAIPSASVAIATYKGSIKKFYQAIAFQLDIPTAETQYILFFTDSTDQGEFARK